MAQRISHKVTVLYSINAGLYRAMQTNEQIYLLGEDILDPYGGAFKVTRGLSSAYPGRVITTPISEAGIVGVAIGMALRGLRPVVEIMFGDFVTLIADQLINHLAKFRWMYNGGKSKTEQVQAPVVIRTPMGGRRGYGPTHSQTLEKLFLGVPGLLILAPTSLGDAGDLLYQTILNTEDPVLFIENKSLYPLPVQDAEKVVEFDLRTTDQNDLGTHRPEWTPDSLAFLNLPTYQLSVRAAPPAMVTITAYGYMAELACQAALELAYRNEVFVEIIVPTLLTPFRIEPILESVRRTHRLLVIEEGTLTLGWGAEIVARTVEAVGRDLHHVRRLGALDLPVPASKPLESAVLPDVDKIIHGVKMVL